MKWNDKESPGRIEVRIFDSSLDIKIILEDLFLTMKLFEVYKRRWESVRNNEAYEFTKGSEPTFIRDE